MKQMSMLTFTTSKICHQKFFEVISSLFGSLGDLSPSVVGNFLWTEGETASYEMKRYKCKLVSFSFVFSNRYFMLCILTILQD